MKADIDAVVACQRCRRRKTKCDKGFPRCRPCAKANSPCMTIEPYSGRGVPRDYLSQLENKVKELEKDLEKEVQSREPSADLITMHPTSQESVFLGASSGLTFARILGTAFREQLGNDASHTNDSTNKIALTPTVRRYSKSSNRGFRLPEKSVGEKYLTAYFNQANPQMPILHREEFLDKYFEPLYGPISPGVDLATVLTKIGTRTSAGPPPPNSFYARSVSSPQSAVPHRKEKIALYFVLQVFAMAVAGHQQQYPPELAEQLHHEAMKYYDIASYSRDRFEALQAVLLLGLYSVMRPAEPGIWYVVGTAMRMCVEMGIHNEERRNSPLYVSLGQDTSGPLLVDKARRLFWCTYALDRQICVYLGRPVSLGDEYVRVRFPCALDDAQLQKGSMPDAEKQVTPADTPSYKWVSIAIFSLRKLQARIQHIIYDKAEVPRAYGSLAEWRNVMVHELHSWYTHIPQGQSVTNCSFNMAYLYLNYQQARLLLFGVSPVNPRPNEEDMEIVADAGQRIIHQYYELFSLGHLNYTWAAVHNLFSASTSYLYCLYHSQHMREATSASDVQLLLDRALASMEALQKYTDAATPCYKSLKILGSAIIKLMRSANGTSPLNQEDLAGFIDVDIPQPLGGGTTWDDYGIKIEEAPGATSTPGVAATATPGMHISPDAESDSLVFNFMNEMSQSFIWDSFLGSNAVDIPTSPSSTRTDQSPRDIL